MNPLVARLPEFTLKMRWLLWLCLSTVLHIIVEHWLTGEVLLSVVQQTCRASIDLYPHASPICFGKFMDDTFWSLVPFVQFLSYWTHSVPRTMCWNSFLLVIFVYIFICYFSPIFAYSVLL